MPGYTAHLDSFARDHLPPRALWPDLRFELPELRYPARLNCAVELLDRAIERGLGDKVAFYSPNQRWTYRELLQRANRIANVLQHDLGLVPGNRVLLRAANNPMLVACWLAVLKAGGIAVTTMPLLRAGELATIIDKAKISLALCDERLGEELERARAKAPVCERVCTFDGSGRPGGGAELERRMAGCFGQLRERRDRRRRCRPDRVHLGHHRQAQGHDALSPRRARDLRLLPALDPEAHAPTTSSSAARRSASPSGSAAP